MAHPPWMADPGSQAPGLRGKEVRPWTTPSAYFLQPEFCPHSTLLVSSSLWVPSSTSLPGSRSGRADLVLAPSGLPGLPHYHLVSCYASLVILKRQPFPQVTDQRLGLLPLTPPFPFMPHLLFYLAVSLYQQPHHPHFISFDSLSECLSLPSHHPHSTEIFNNSLGQDLLSPFYR